MTKPFELSVPQPPPSGVVVTPSSDALPAGYGSQLGQFLALDYTAPISKPNGTYERDVDGNYNPGSSKIAGNVVLDDQAYVKTGVDALQGGNCYWAKKDSKAVISWAGPYGFMKPEFAGTELAPFPVAPKSGYTLIVENPVIHAPFVTFNIGTYHRFTNFIYIHGREIETPNNVFGAGMIDNTVVCVTENPGIPRSRLIIVSNDAHKQNPTWTQVGNVFTSLIFGESILSGPGCAIFSEDGLNIVQMVDSSYADSNPDRPPVQEGSVKRGILRITLKNVLGAITVDTSNYTTHDSIFFSDSSKPTNVITEAIGFIGNVEKSIETSVSEYTHSRSHDRSASPRSDSTIFDRVTTVLHKVGNFLIVTSEWTDQTNSLITAVTITPPDPDPPYTEETHQFSWELRNFSYLFFYVAMQEGKFVVKESVDTIPPSIFNFTVSQNTIPATVSPVLTYQLTRKHKYFQFSRTDKNDPDSVYVQTDLHAVVDTVTNPDLVPNSPTFVDSTFSSTIRVIPQPVFLEFFAPDFRLMFLVEKSGFLLGLIKYTKSPPDPIDPTVNEAILPAGNSLNSLFGMSGDGATLIKDLDVKNAIFRM